MRVVPRIVGELYIDGTAGLIAGVPDAPDRPKRKRLVQAVARRPSVLQYTLRLLAFDHAHICSLGEKAMALIVRRAAYFQTTVRDQPGEAYKLLTQFVDLGINLLAFTAVPAGPLSTQLSIFPEDPETLLNTAQQAGLGLDGPNPALLVQGDDRLGALADLHAKLFEANVNVYASSGVTDGRGGYGYVLYVKPDEYERAAAALGL